MNSGAEVIFPARTSSQSAPGILDQRTKVAHHLPVNSFLTGGAMTVRLGVIPAWCTLRSIICCSCVVDVCIMHPLQHPSNHCYILLQGPSRMKRCRAKGDARICSYKKKQARAC